MVIDSAAPGQGTAWPRSVDTSDAIRSFGESLEDDDGLVPGRGRHAPEQRDDAVTLPMVIATYRTGKTDLPRWALNFSLPTRRHREQTSWYRRAIELDDRIGHRFTRIEIGRMPSRLVVTRPAQCESQTR
jgi:hypothetical protein